MHPLKKAIFASLFVAAGSWLWAQNYSVNWHVIPGGGGTSSGGQYSLSGSIGQAAAGSTMAGGQYSLTGGFWSFVSVVQMPGAPLLTISQSNGQLTISWPTPSSAWTLQQNSSLANAGGWGASGYVVSSTNGVSRIIIPAATMGNLFFRLKQP